MPDDPSASNPSAGANHVQLLLRFLSQDAKLPLSVALGQAALLQKASLGSPEAIANSKLDALTSTLQLDQKQAKQVWNAAKRASKKRQHPEQENSVENDSQSQKRKKTGPGFAVQQESLEEIEHALALPTPETDIDAISDTILVTNRAPLMLAFTVVLLEYTMPEQPLSSRLSLAQAVVSTGAQKKAVSLGIQAGPGAEEEGWGKGQPVARILGRDISVMRRGDYELKQDMTEAQDSNAYADSESKGTALWGLDLEALKKPNGPPLPSAHSPNRALLPIYHASSARNYLYKSFGNTSTPLPTESKKLAKPKGKGAALESERNLALLLGAIKLLYDSWKDTLDAAELDRRAFGWYIRSRPDVDQGVAGWGSKGEVVLKKILGLRREAPTRHTDQ